MSDETASDEKLSHIDAHGDARMVDVSAKADTERVARATGVIRMRPDTLQVIRSGTVAKGDVYTVARIAGIMAAKRTAELIPLCHPLPLTDVQVTLSADDSLPGLLAEATVRTVGKTGVEMEALTAVSVTLLTVYDMVKAIDRAMVISDILLEEKGGGRSGHWFRA
ncbi:MAG TPA: cyclic pyranopterin monophosphate synthase MoaC [Gemmatimonadaceae bacterium]|jgi:cyclic pyranopterin phosphate synthase|nr:cyclic pyranopterin monophosphate synthase MoaC [Gemmatimonadaceae bacterium]